MCGNQIFQVLDSNKFRKYVLYLLSLCTHNYFCGYFLFIFQTYATHAGAIGGPCWGIMCAQTIDSVVHIVRAAIVKEKS